MTDSVRGHRPELQRLLSVGGPYLYGTLLLDDFMPYQPHHIGRSVRLTAASPRLFEDAGRGMSQWDITSSWFQYGRLCDGRAYLQWVGLCDFLVSADGRVIEYNLLCRDAQEAFENYLFTHAMSFALLKQGVESLHATTVFIDQQAVAFVGDCGMGKSTLAAAFLRAGARLVTDDLLALFSLEGSLSSYSGFYACPGPARLKLFPDTAQALLGPLPTITPMHPDTSKVILPLAPAQHCANPVPISVIYLIEEPPISAAENDPIIEPLRPPEALLSILGSTFNAMVTDELRLAGQFQFASRLARSLPVRRLRYARTLSQLPSVVSAVRQDLLC